MARDLATNDYLSNSSTPLSNSYPYAMAAWFNADSASGNQTILLNGINTHAGSLDTIRVSGTIRATTRSGGVEESATSGGTVSGGTWHHAAGIFQAGTARRAYLDGGNKGTQSNLNLSFSHGSIWIGRRPWSFAREDFAGLIAEAALWDLSVWPGATASDKCDAFESAIAAMGEGYSPLNFPLGLVFFAPLIGRNSPEIDRVGGYNLTLSGTAAASHPRIIYPTRRGRVFVTSAGGGSSVSFNQATEQNTALPIAIAKTKTIAISPEQNTALATTLERAQPIAIASEQNLAQPISSASGAVIGQATEQDTALAHTWSRAVDCGLAAEQDTALATTAERTQPIGQANEQDLAQTWTITIAAAIGQATEQDTSLIATWSKTVAAAIASEQDRALAITVSMPSLAEPVISRSLPERQTKAAVPDRRTQTAMELR